MEKKGGYKNKAKQISTLKTFVKLIRAAESVNARVHRHLKANGLTESQFAALEALLHLGPLNQQQIAKKILKSSGNITMVIDNLEKRNLVGRERGVNDRRVVTIQLTGEGHRLIREVFPRHAAVIENEMNILTKTEREELGRLCRKVGLKKRDP